MSFQYRIAIDAYEQMNGKVKAPRLTYGLPDQPTKPGKVSRVLQAIRRLSLGRGPLVQAMSAK